MIRLRSVRPGTWIVVTWRFHSDIVSCRHVLAHARSRPPSHFCPTTPHSKSDPRLLGSLGWVDSRRHGFLYLRLSPRTFIARASAALGHRAHQRKHRRV